MPELTPEQRLSITRHLAEKVMGLKEERDVVPSKGCFVATDRSLWVWKPYANHATEWAPLTNANETDEVAVATMKQRGKGLFRLTYVPLRDEWEATITPGGQIVGEVRALVNVAHHDKNTAACLACAKATGWEG